MEDDAGSFGSFRSSRAYQSTIKSHSDLCIDLEEFEGEDESKVEYPCPFCPEDFDLLGLCCHIDEEHHIEATAGVCPVCAAIVGMNIVGHIMRQHGSFFKNWHRLKCRKGEFYSISSFSKKEFQNGRFQSLAGSCPVSTSKMVPDPLLSFLYKEPASDNSESVRPVYSEVGIEDDNSDEKITEGDFQLNPLSDKDQMEKAKRREFVQGLFLSTIFDDSL